MKEDHLILMSGMVTYLEDHLHMIQQPMVLAKAVYALDLFEEGSEVSNKGLEKLWWMKRKNELGKCKGFFFLLKESGVPFLHHWG